MASWRAWPAAIADWLEVAWWSNPPLVDPSAAHIAPGRIGHRRSFGLALAVAHALTGLAPGWLRQRFNFACGNPRSAAGRLAESAWRCRRG
ncbi:hypothetical protein ACU4GD_34420 [Cupriavidus basilensis]